MAFRRTGTMPAPTRGQSNDTSFAAQTKAAFSSNPRQTDSFDADFDAEDELHAPPRAATGPASRRTREDDEYALLHQSEERLDDVGLVHPGRPVSYGQPEREDGSPARPPGHGGYNSGSYHGEAGSGVDTSYGGPYGAHNNRSGSVGGSGDPFRSDLELSHGAGDYDLAGGRPYGGVAPPPMYER
jgi:translocation protein SEC72